MINTNALLIDPYKEIYEGHFPEYRKRVFAEAEAKGIQLAELGSLVDIFGAEKSKVFFINFNLGSRQEVGQHLLILLALALRKDVRVVVHSLSKLPWVNRVFLSLPLCFFVFSRAVFAYGLDHNIPLNNVTLLDFPNAEVGRQIISHRIDTSAWDVAIWGNANKYYFDSGKFKKNVPAGSRCHLGNGCHQYSAMLTSMGYTVWCHDTADTSGLREMLSLCSHFSMQFTSSFDYYEKKINASGVFLTSQEAGLIGICDFLFGYYIEDLEFTGRHILVGEFKGRSMRPDLTCNINMETAFERLFR